MQKLHVFQGIPQGLTPFAAYFSTLFCSIPARQRR
jgi:hypothetical protein